MENNEKIAKIGTDIMNVIHEGNISIEDTFAVLESMYCVIVKETLRMCPDEKMRKYALRHVKYALDRVYLCCEDINEKINKKR